MAKENMECCYEDQGKVVIAALVIAVGILGGGYFISQGNGITPNVYLSDPNQHAIEVSGSASERIAPDLLTIQLRVQTEAENAKDAQSENAVLSNQLLAKLKSMGLADADISTDYYSVEPVTKSVYECDVDDKCRWDYVIEGYKTVHTVSVRLDDLDKGGEVIDAAAEVGANQTFTDSVTFGLKPETKQATEKALLKKASEEAKSKAMAIAQGLGSQLGKVVSASESYYPTYYYDTRDVLSAYSEAAAAPTTISPGEIEVSATVSVNYEIA